MTDQRLRVNRLLCELLCIFKPVTKDTGHGLELSDVEITATVEIRMDGGAAQVQEEARFC